MCIANIFEEILPKHIRCDVCGQFISLEDLVNGEAVTYMVTPDSEYTVEEFETLCRKHKVKT